MQLSKAHGLLSSAASLNASNDPLIVIDGVPMAHSSLSILNPNDIESFSVLKDASAAAIYGYRVTPGMASFSRCRRC